MEYRRKRAPSEPIDSIEPDLEGKTRHALNRRKIENMNEMERMENLGKMMLSMDWARNEQKRLRMHSSLKTMVQKPENCFNNCSMLCR